MGHPSTQGDSPFTDRRRVAYVVGNAELVQQLQKPPY